MKTHVMPTYFVSHGGGPWPWLKKEMPYFDALEESLQAIPKELGEKPKAILMISGHWEENDFTVMTTVKPPMIYDYSGFPEHTYHIQYPAAGSPAVASRVAELLKAYGIAVGENSTRGYDHGTYTTAYPMYPEADVPVIQLSIKKNYDPLAHIKLGEALRPLREEGVLIIGSGLSYHNLRAMFRRDPAVSNGSKEFDNWLQETLLHSSPDERVARLLKWADAPSARAAHPQEDHLIPLMVVVGAARNEKAAMNYHEDDFMGTIATSSFKFG